jgi:hypothetical protein
MTNKLHFICIDKRFKDPKNNQIYIQLENGARVVMPPNIQSVPALLCPKKNYSVLLGNSILEYFEGQNPYAGHEQSKAMMHSQMEPSGYSLNSSDGMNIVSEQYTMYNMSPDELSSSGFGGKRQMYDYVSANSDGNPIYTPDDDYKPDKVSSGTTVEQLQSKRDEEIFNARGGGGAAGIFGGGAPQQSPFVPNPPMGVMNTPPYLQHQGYQQNMQMQQQQHQQQPFRPVSTMNQMTPQQGFRGMQQQPQPQPQPQQTNHFIQQNMRMPSNMNQNTKSFSL